MAFSGIPVHPDWSQYFLGSDLNSLGVSDLHLGLRAISPARKVKPWLIIKGENV